MLKAELEDKVVELESRLKEAEKENKDLENQLKQMNQEESVSKLINGTDLLDAGTDEGKMKDSTTVRLVTKLGLVRKLRKAIGHKDA